jgi:hypothetical protein
MGHAVLGPLDICGRNCSPPTVASDLALTLSSLEQSGARPPDIGRLFDDIPTFCTLAGDFPPWSARTAWLLFVQVPRNASEGQPFAPGA